MDTPERRQAIIEALQTLSLCNEDFGLGYCVSHSEFAAYRKAFPELGLPTSATAARWFGSWDAVCAEAGIPSIPPQNTTTDWEAKAERSLDQTERILRLKGEAEVADQLQEERNRREREKAAARVSPGDLEAVLDDKLD